MPCPPHVSEILLSIIQTGLLRIRSLAWEGQAEHCAIEADHIHNIPEILADYSPEKLAYYWGTERPAYASEVDEAELSCWEPLWDRLGEQLGAEASLPSSR
jgi:hypothetical protein